jgi:succinate-semialdehyde dehydrogenase/glutarate-semialdehyde dehydrogenase
MLKMSSSQDVLSNLSAGLFIGGEWRQGSSGQRFDVQDPSTGEAVAEVADATVEDGAAAVEAAAAAAASWAAVAPRKRSELLRRVYDLMLARGDMLAKLIVLENGKSLADARSEVGYAAEFFRWFSEEAVRISGDVGMAPSGANRIVVQYEPVGIALLITPWNFPAAMATRKIAPALAAGCTCILKPAPETPLTACALMDVFKDAGVPNGVVNLVSTSRSSEVVGAIMSDPRVRKLSFTGSTAVGSLLLAQAAGQIMNCSMELGGNAPFIVFDDADLNLALEGAMIAKMRNGGQACTAANRFYVQDGIFDAFTQGLVARMAAQKVGPGHDETVQVGPVISERSRGRIDGLVRQAIDGGARTLTGGTAPAGQGFYYPPTVLTDVQPDARIMNEEIFGPVATVTRFATEDEAVTAANATEYGLISYVFTGDLARGLRVSERLQAGMIGLNRGLVSDPAAPFGGVKQSGLGREGAHHGIMEFLEAKYVAVAW